LGDPSRLLDALFVNVPRVSFIDPTMDRCAAASEWLSSSDLYRSNYCSDSSERYRMEQWHVPTVAALVHVLCRVEQPPDLNYSTRDWSDVHFRREANRALVSKFAQGLPAPVLRTHARAMTTDLIPQAMWILSAGKSGALDRAVSSFSLLHQREQQAVDQHVQTLLGLGLTYRVSQEEALSLSFSHSRELRLDPPIDKLVQFDRSDGTIGSSTRRTIPQTVSTFKRAAKMPQVFSVRLTDPLIPATSDERIARSTLDS
jgi:chromosome transmission fidelity protein 18